jgi:hypothetical protein
MRRVPFLAFAFLAAATPVAAQSPFDGAWKLDPRPTAFSPRTFDISLKDGVYSCRSCKPEWAVAADGAFHRVKGHDDYDETAINVLDDRNVIFTRKRGGRAVYQAVDKLSEDGHFLVFAVTEFSGAGKPMSATGSWVRVSPRPSGSHPITGIWRELAPDVLSENVWLFTIHTQGDTFTMTFGTGESLTAMLGGQATKVEGDPSGTSVSVRRIGETSFEETDRREGEIVEVRTSTLLDNSTLEIVSRRTNGSETRRLAHRLERVAD